METAAFEREVSYCFREEGPHHPWWDHMGWSGGRSEGEVWARAFIMVFHGVEMDELG